MGKPPPPQASLRDANMYTDDQHMIRAIELAKRQNGRTGSNPSVGCVIVDRDGIKVAEAATGDGGRPHAEQLALSRLPAGRVIGGTAYVTLEPCRERSTQETSCASRLIEAGISRTVVCHLDPHPLGKGGVTALRDAGVSVEVGYLRDTCAGLYTNFKASLSHT